MIEARTARRNIHLLIWDTMFTLASVKGYDAILRTESLFI